MQYIKKADYFFPALLITLVLIFYHRILLFGEVLYVGDNLSLIAPMKSLFVYMLTHKTPLLWNPYIFSGTPFLADINNGLLYPFNIFYFFFPPLRALSFIVAIEVACAGIFMYAYAKSLKLKPFVAFICGALFMFSGSIMQLAQNTAALDVIIWIPLLLLLANQYFESKKTIYIVLSIIVLTLQLFAGHIQFFYYTILFIVSYVLFFIKVNIKNKIRFLLILLGTTASLGAVQIIPFLEMVSYATRPAQSVAFASSGSFPVINLIHLLIANAFGVQRLGTSWGAQADINGYVGIVPILFIIFLFKSRINRGIIFFGTLALVSLLLSLGKYSPLFYIAYYLLPFFSRFRAGGGILILYTFSMVILTGYSLQNIETMLIKHNALLKKTGIWLFFTGALITVPCLFLFLTNFSTFYLVLYKLSTLKYIHRFLAYPPYQIKTIFQLWAFNLIFIGTTLVGFGMSVYYAIKTKNLSLSLIIIAFLIIGDVFQFAHNSLLTTNPAALNPPKSLLTFLNKNLGYSRIYTIIDGPKKPTFGDQNYFKQEAFKSFAYIKPDSNELLLIPSIDGYASMVNKNYNAFISPRNQLVPTSIGVPDLNGSTLDVASVKYIITGGYKEDELKKNSKYKLVYEYKNRELNRTFYVYEKHAVQPRAFLQHNNVVTPIEITKYTPNSVSLHISTPQKGSVVLTDTYYPGWKAYANGNELVIQKYKGVFRKVSVDEKVKDVTFIYKPVSIVIGLSISASAFFFLLVYVLYVVNKRLFIKK